MAVENALDEGVAYGRPPGQPNHDLIDTAPGTKMGELLRRYWLPVGLATDATTRSRLIRALCEDLIVFRDERGRPGLLYPRCTHRGTSLYYGKVEDRGIRSQERYGLIFAYMGPPDRRPVLPRWDVLEELAEDETIEASDCIQSGPKAYPCSWTHHFDNVPDHYHMPILHGSISGSQFTDLMARMPRITWEHTAAGVVTRARRVLDDGTSVLRITEAVLPNVRLIPDPRVSRYQKSESVSWLLPVDDSHYMLYAAVRTRPGWTRAFTKQGGKSWDDMTEAEHQEFPDDYEAQTGQGAITFHSEEHLASTDRGIVMLRRLLLQQADVVAAGKDPLGVNFDDDGPVQTEAGNFWSTTERCRERYW
jgi:phenylpropionate dioxygenase-like ring-hydroxylating dioxygenase large terminal subunit